MNKFKFLLGLCALAIIGSTIFTGCKGKDGEIGPAGANGTNGLNGIDGTNGTNGTNGVDGLNGVDGVDANSFCRDCHNTANWTAVIAQLESSKHGDRTGNMAEEGQRRDCAKCHSAQGFFATLENGLDTPSVNYGSNSQWAASTNFTLTCDVCHEFHGTLDEADFPNYALRHVSGFAPIFDKTKSWDFGGSNACMSCHQNRPNTSVKDIAGVNTIDLATTADGDSVRITSQRYGGHHGPQGQLYAGVGKGNYEITGTASYSNSTGHSSLICGDCHIMSTASNADSTGGHYYKLAKRDSKNATVAGTENVTKCVSCHTGTTDHNINGVQAAVKQLMLDIETYLVSKNILANTGGPNGYGGVNSNGYIFGDNGTSNASSSNPLRVTAKQAKAIFNFKCVYEDYSYGVHNANYIKALLQNSKEAILTIQ